MSLFMCAIPGVEWVFPGDDVGAVPSHKHFDAIIEGANSGLGHWTQLDD